MGTSFEGQVAIVTGAGRGIGRAHALALAKRGARVVVNDVGGGKDGSNPSSAPADEVVAEIRAAGGEAVASYESVSDPAAARDIVARALDAFGALHIVVNNAGIFGGRPFVEMRFEDFQRMVEVHLLGTAAVTHAAWPHLVARRYGRVIMTASSAGFWGIENVSGYCAAKAGIVGLAKGLAHEGNGHNITVNVVAPGAKTRSSAHMFEGRAGWTWRPELVTPAMIYFASEACRHNGAVFAALAGHYAKVETVQAPGFHFDARKDVPDDAFAAALDSIEAMDGARALGHGLSDEIRATSGAASRQPGD